ncbi:MAG: hypothetical protein KatS3mg115_1626 [Candidatus Poribacteria bacterium]|nr:MAG: hypothetical protein KatS3mg115_1626 [Candidatus Poribacteria bacterium]
MKKTLLLALGNTLRGDDGVGPWIAEQLREDPRVLEAVDIEITHQLLIEHADQIAQYQQVVFVDAHTELETSQWLRIAPLEANPPASVSSHHLSPAALLQMARQLYGAQTEGWIVSVRAERFQIGAGLSPKTQAAAKKAISALYRLLGVEENRSRGD